MQDSKWRALFSHLRISHWILRSSVALDKLLRIHVFETEPNGCMPSLYRISNAVRREHFRRVRKIAKSDYQLCGVSLSVRMELGFHWTDFHETWYLSVFRKSVEKIEVSLKSDKNNGYFTWRPVYIFCSVCLFSWLYNPLWLYFPQPLSGL
jgi:hypothetical protein